MTVAERLGAAAWYGWPVGSAVRATGSRELLRVTGHLLLAFRRGPQLRLRSTNGITELRIGAGACVPALDDDATAALLLARLWHEDAGWHLHATEHGHVVHIDPELGEWCAPTRGEALALAALACLPEHPAPR